MFSTSVENNWHKVKEKYKGTGCARSITFIRVARCARREAARRDARDRIKSSRPIPSGRGVVALRMSIVGWRLPKIAEMHVEAGGQSDLVGKRSRCDSTDSVENLGTFARTQARVWAHARVRACRTRGHGRGGRA